MKRTTLFFLAGLIVFLFTLTSTAGLFGGAGDPVLAFKNQHQLNPKVLQLADKAYENARKQGIDDKQILTIIDYSLPSSQKRMWVLDLKRNKVAYHTLVAHGQGSGKLKPTKFSNKSGTHASSFGVFQTANTYIGGKGLALKLKGLEPGFNNNAFARTIVFHGANYVSEAFVKATGYLGRSWGCPALSKAIASKVINTIKKDTLVFAYYPDQKWLKTSKFL